MEDGKIIKSGDGFNSKISIFWEHGITVSHKPD